MNKNIFYVLLAYGTTVLASLMTALILPKFMSIEQYGYLRLFTLYFGFLGLAHLGFNDGVISMYRRSNLEDLPPVRFRSYFLFLTLFQLVVAVILLLPLFAFTSGDRFIVYLFLLINIPIVNCMSYFNYLYQITREFKFFAIVTSTNSFCLLLSTIILLFAHQTNYLPYILVQTIINLLFLFVYIIKSKHLVFGKRESFASIKDNLQQAFQIGIHILIGNLMGILVVGVDRMFIEHFYSLTDFAYYSFAVTLMGLVFTFIAAVANYAYAYLSRVRRENLPTVYENASILIIILGAFLMLTFYGVKYFVLHYIPKYEPVINITLILYPTIILRAVLGLLSANLYKCLDLQKDYNRNNLFALIVTVLFNLIAILFHANLETMAFCNLVSFYLWFLYTDIYFGRVLKVKVRKKNIMLLVLIGIFIATEQGGVSYYLMFVLVLLILSKKKIIGMKKLKI